MWQIPRCCLLIVLHAVFRIRNKLPSWGETIASDDVGQDGSAIMRGDKQGVLSPRLSGDHAAWDLAEV